MASERVESWKRQQAAIRARMAVEPVRELPRFVAGADCAFTSDKRQIVAAAVVWDVAGRRLIETQVVRQLVDVPYIPGYLAFREGPAVIEALAQLQQPFKAVLFDAHGYAHPRRCGLATFVGVQTGVRAVGVAKSRLVGEHAEPAAAAGAHAPLEDAHETIGSVLRTRTGVRPVYVSVGHRVDLPCARQLVLACCAGYRLPEPTRWADRLAGQHARGRPGGGPTSG